ncbi:hypothetical protein CSUI_008616 [Cystoisospora suis]|uniref:Transmembrane protein n=1 Tax=Cystoisospora suis TaxID=483139 RepID=A0A2C6KJ37_9APIC|nr:hypothetical protein CSUI_008616 [Cystoisospora suis]
MSASPVVSGVPDLFLYSFSNFSLIYGSHSFPVKFTNHHRNILFLQLSHAVAAYGVLGLYGRLVWFT